MSRQTRKGYRGEDLCAKMLNEWGTEGGCPTRARRGDGTAGEDVYVHVGAAEFRVECKFHAKDIVTIRKWLESSDALCFRSNHKDPWFILKPNALRDMLAEAYASGQIAGLRMKEAK